MLSIAYGDNGSYWVRCGMLTHPTEGALWLALTFIAGAALVAAADLLARIILRMGWVR